MGKEHLYLDFGVSFTIGVKWFPHNHKLKTFVKNNMNGGLIIFNEINIINILLL